MQIDQSLHPIFYGNNLNRALDKPVYHVNYENIWQDTHFKIYSNSRAYHVRKS